MRRAAGWHHLPVWRMHRRPGLCRGLCGSLVSAVHSCRCQHRLHAAPDRASHPGDPCLAARVCGAAAPLLQRNLDPSQRTQVWPVPGLHPTLHRGSPEMPARQPGTAMDLQVRGAHAVAGHQPNRRAHRREGRHPLCGGCGRVPSSEVHAGPRPAHGHGSTKVSRLKWHRRAAPSVLSGMRPRPARLPTVEPAVRHCPAAAGAAAAFASPLAATPTLTQASG